MKMKLIRKRNDFLSWRKELSESNPNTKVGLVPTMGNLHIGHLSLARKALAENDQVIVTIFVNPKQFGPNEDFDQYPRTLDQDMEKLSQLEGSERITVFNPASQDEIYPENFQTTITVNTLDKVLCGKYRSTHFAGVTTVVYQLFALSQATQAYFGQKDFQQFKIIERMVKDLLLPIELHMCPIIREDDGLALSSRNQYLSNEQRVEAIKLNQALNSIKDAYYSHGKIAAFSKRAELIANDSRFQYLEILETQTLGPEIAEVHDGFGKVVVAGAFILGDTRLIDNLLI